RGGPYAAPPDGGTGVRAAGWCRRVRSLAVEFADLDRAAVLEVRMIARARDRLVVVSRFDQVEAAQHFFRFAVRTVGGPRLSVHGLHQTSAVFAEALAVDRERFLRPRHVFFHGFLHLFRAERFEMADGGG